MKVKKLCQLFGMILFFYLLIKLISDICFKKKTIEYFGDCTPDPAIDPVPDCTDYTGETGNATEEEARIQCIAISGCVFTPDPTTLCEINQYVASNTCLPCPPGTTNEAGDDSGGPDTTCISTLCGVDQYALNHICTSCPGGTTHEAGDDASGPGTPCTSTDTSTPAPTTLCEINQFVASNTCLPCPPGTTNEAGDDSGGPDTTCISTLCGVDQYALNHICTSCPDGTTHEAGDDASGPGTPCTSTDTSTPDTSTQIDETLIDSCIQPSVISGYNIVNQADLTRDNFDVDVQCLDGYEGDAVATVCTENRGEYLLSGCTPNDVSGTCLSIECAWPQRRKSNSENIESTNPDDCCEKSGLCIGNDNGSDNHQCSSGLFHRYNAAVWPMPCPEDRSISFPQCFDPVSIDGNNEEFLEPTLDNLSIAYQNSRNDPAFTIEMAKNDICCINPTQHNFIERIYGSQINIGRALDLENRIKTEPDLTDDEKKVIMNEILEILNYGLMVNPQNLTIIEVIQNLDRLSTNTVDYGSGYCKGNLNSDEDVTCDGEEPMVLLPYITEGSTTDDCCKIVGKCAGNSDGSSIECPIGYSLKENHEEVQIANIENCCRKLTTCSDIDDCNVNTELKLGSNNIFIQDYYCEINQDETCPNDCISKEEFECINNNDQSNNSVCRYNSDTQQCENLEDSADCQKQTNNVCVKDVQDRCCEEMIKCSENSDSSLDHICNDLTEIRDDSSGIYISNRLDTSLVNNLCCITTETISTETIVSAQIEIDVDPTTIGSEGTPERETFNSNLANDIAMTLGVDPTTIVINNISVAVDVDVERFTVEGYGEGVTVDWSYEPTEGGDIIETTTIQRVFENPGVTLPSTGATTTSAVSNVTIDSSGRVSYLLYLIIGFLIVISLFLVFSFGFGGLFIAKKVD
jgi:hypothetical protein